MTQLLIWDTDLDSDCDDIAATALITGFVKSGEATLLAATVASENAYAAPAMRALLSNAGLGGVPIGAYQGSAIGGPTDSKYTQQVAALYGDRTETRSDYSNAVAVLRQALSGAPDGSVKIVTGGTLTNIAALLRSPPDSISPLSGAQLVAQKVSSINSMGGNFTNPAGEENNIRFDIDAANYVAANSPVDVIWSGYEVGNPVKTTVPITGEVDTAFELGWSLSSSQQVNGTRSSWDLTAIHYAVRDPSSLYTVGGSGGLLSFDANSLTHFTGNAGGRNAFISKVASDTTIANELNAVIASGALGINRSPTGTLSISGNVVEDAVLTAVSNLADADGIGVLSFQWLRNGTGINGATDANYVLRQADVGASISLRATYVDGRGNPELVTSSSVGVIRNVNDAPTGTVTITGLAVSGSTLTVSNTLVDEDGLGSIGYQWLRDGSAIANATGATYTLTQADVDATITVRASYIDGQGTWESRTSAATPPISSPQVDPVYEGTASADIFTASTSSDWVIKGLAGNDRLAGQAGSDTIEGGADNDILSGNDGADLLDGGTGGDELSGGYGDDIFIVDSTADVVKEQGGQGIDAVRTNLRSYSLPGNVEDLVFTGALAAALNGNSIANTIRGGTADDVLNGLGGNDLLDGSAGNDRLDGGTGADQMTGGTGNDLYLVDSGSDVVVESAGGGTDRISASVSIALTANVENLTLTGSNAINGTGNALSNRIEASLGKNVLTGGDSSDRFVFVGATQQNSAFTTGATASTRDIITDFQTGLDRIDLSAIDASVRSFFDLYDNDAFHRISAARSFSGNSSATLIYYHEYSNGAWRTIVAGNIDNDSTPEFQIELAGQMVLGSSDFVF